MRGSVFQSQHILLSDWSNAFPTSGTARRGEDSGQEVTSRVMSVAQVEDGADGVWTTAETEGGSFQRREPLKCRCIDESMAN